LTNRTNLSIFLERSKHRDQETYRILGVLCLIFESLPMGRISPDSLQDEGNASPRDLRECFFITPVGSVQPTGHLRPVSKLYTL